MGLFNLLLFSGAVQKYTIYVLKPIGFISLAKPTYEMYCKGIPNKSKLVAKGCKK